jgi:hypothetical protein
MKKLVLSGMVFIFLLFMFGCSSKNQEPHNPSNLFQNGLMAVCEVDGLCGFINESGKVVIDLAYDRVSMFSSGYAQVSYAGDMGIINTRGKEIIPVQYDFAGSFPTKGFMKYSVEFQPSESFDQRYHYVNMYGKPIKDSVVYELMGYDDSTLVMSRDYLGSGKYSDYYFKRVSDGSIVIEDIVMAAKEAYSESNLVCISTTSNCRLIDENGSFLTARYYRYPFVAYGEDLYAVKSGSKFGLINGNGDELIPFLYDSPIRFNEAGVSLIRIDRGSNPDYY